MGWKTLATARQKIPVLTGLRLLNDWGEQISHKSRYGCAASAESRLHKISPKNLIPKQQMPQNLMTSQVFMKFRVKISEFFNK